MSTRCPSQRGPVFALRALAIALSAPTVVSCTSEPMDEEASEAHAQSAACGGVHEGTLSLRTRQDMAAAAKIEVVRGDVLLHSEGDATLVVGPLDLPCLRRIEGALRVGVNGVTRAGAIELPALERVDGSLAVGFVIDGDGVRASIALPRLTRIGSEHASDGPGLQVGESQLGGGFHAERLRIVLGLVSIGALVTPRIDLDALELVTGSLQIGPAEQLEELRLSALHTVQGPLTLQHLPLVAYSPLAALLSKASVEHVHVEAIGCSRPDGDGSPDCE